MEAQENTDPNPEKILEKIFQSRKQKNKDTPTDTEEVKRQIQQRLAGPKREHRLPLTGKNYVGTGIDGIDQLFNLGIPRGSSSLIVGGPGSGKTIFCLQSLYEAARAGENVFYITLEEKPEQLKQHLKDFGMDITDLEHRGKFIIKRFSPIDITRQIDAMLEQAKGELLIDLKPLLFPENFTPDRIAIDSLSAISAALFGKEESYRIYIEQLFNLLNGMGSTSFLISETPDPLLKLSVSGTEEFLADGVLIFYNVRHGNIRESAFEVLKMRGSGFKKKIVAMQIQPEKGIVVYPDQEVFTTI